LHAGFHVFLILNSFFHDEKKRIEDEVKTWNPACNYPTMVINDKKCVVGFKEDEIKEALVI